MLNQIPDLVFGISIDGKMKNEKSRLKFLFFKIKNCKIKKGRERQFQNLKIFPVRRYFSRKGIRNQEG